MGEMNMKTIGSFLLLIVVVAVILCLAAGPVHAQKPIGKAGKADSALGGDKTIGSKRGMDVLNNDKKDDKDKGKKATKLQMMVGVGSIFVMIAVVKWL
jgi:hypothetical protein